MGSPAQRLDRLYRLEVVLAVISGLLCLVTLAVPYWIEVLFGVDPDRGSGTVEWLVVAALFVVSLGTSVLARRHRKLSLARRRRPLPAGAPRAI